jgi:hypothetical protein
MRAMQHGDTPRRPPESLDELRQLLTPEMWAELRSARPVAEEALASGFPARLILPRSWCLGFAGRWGLSSDPETISGLVALLLATVEEDGGGAGSRG